MNNSRPFIRHFTIELWNNSQIDINSEALFDCLIKELNLIVVSENKHIFQNGGITKLCILSTSHVALHTWPELGYTHIDLLTCSENITKDLMDKKLTELIKKTNDIHSYIIQ